MKTRTLVIFGWFLSIVLVHSQGFVNLDFEQAQIVINPGFGAYASNAIPGWTAYIGGNPQTYIIYNTVSLGAPSVDLEGPGSSFSPMQGNYFVLLQGDSNGFGVAAGIGQTGQIPLSALSLIFSASIGSGFPPSSPITQVSFDGQPLAMNTYGNSGQYIADISPYAGQTGELLFTAFSNGSMRLDDIQFSTSPVPEPSASAFCALGGMLFVWRNRRIFQKT